MYPIPCPPYVHFIHLPIPSPFAGLEGGGNEVHNEPNSNTEPETGIRHSLPNTMVYIYIYILLYVCIRFLAPPLVHFIHLPIPSPFAGLEGGESEVHNEPNSSKELTTGIRHALPNTMVYNIYFAIMYPIPCPPYVHFIHLPIPSPFAGLEGGGSEVHNEPNSSTELTTGIRHSLPNTMVYIYIYIYIAIMYPIPFPHTPQ